MNIATEITPSMRNSIYTLDIKIQLHFNGIHSFKFHWKETFLNKGILYNIQNEMYVTCHFFRTRN